MEFNDPVYGSFSVRDPAVKELVASAPVQRLKGVNQAGAVCYVEPERYVNTRFAHSLGVYYLLRKFNASMEEQIAGLLHDIGHTAFSHVADYLLEGGAQRQDYNDRVMRTVMARSEIPAILRSHGFNTEDILDKERFKMMKRPVPDICADVLDYFFRDAIVLGLKKGMQDEVRLFISALQVQGDEFVFSNIEMARRAALDFMECNRKFWSSPASLASCYVLADAIKGAMKSGGVGMDDLMLTDDALFAKLEKSANPDVVARLKELEGLRAFISGSGGLLAQTKARYIDPKVLQKGNVMRLSEYDGGFKALAGQFSESMEKGFRIKIL
jgi:uncharacterized protein